MSKRLQEELKMTREFESPEQETFLSLLRTADGLLGELDRLLREGDISTPLYNVLRILRGAGEDGLPCGEIGARLVKRDPDVTRLVDRLLGMGLAERRRSEEDRRVVRVRITRQGLDRLAGLDGQVARLHRGQLGHLGLRRLGELVRLLEDARDRQ